MDFKVGDFVRTKISPHIIYQIIKINWIWIDTIVYGEFNGYFEHQIVVQPCLSSLSKHKKHLHMRYLHLDEIKEKLDLSDQWERELVVEV